MPDLLAPPLPRASAVHWSINPALNWFRIVTVQGGLAGADFAGHCLSMGQGIVGIRNNNPITFSAGIAS